MGQVLEGQEDHILVLGGGNIMGRFRRNVDKGPLGRYEIMAVDVALERPLDDEIELFVGVRVDLGGIQGP